MGDIIEEEDLVPRDYQTKLTEIAISQNSIIFLPTGTGKTFIATMVLRQLSQPLERPTSEGGKISCMLVNTVALVEQQSKHLSRNTHLTVGAYSGDMNVDNWGESTWKREINQHQVLVMTAQILLNLLESSIIRLNEINLIIFDECHRGVSDHCMRQIMMHFKDLQDPPRVVGLTATLLNKNIKPCQVIENVKALEATFHSKIATVDELRSVLGYRTNPNERVKVFVEHTLTTIDKRCVTYLENMIDHLKTVKIDSGPTTSSYKLNLKPLEPEKGLKQIINLIKDTVVHINMLGTFGGQIAILAHMIQLERLKKSSQTKQTTMILDSILTTFSVTYKLFGDEMKYYSDKDKVYKFSAHQVHILLDTIREYKNTSKEPLCGIVFVQRRFTAKVIYYILLHLQKCDSEFSDIKPNYIVGYNTNPFSDTREGLYNVKMNRKVLSQFENKEINMIVASNVLEEGVDIPMCTFVIRFDKPVDYRAYIQSKGRARHRNSFFYMLIDRSEIVQFSETYKIYQKVEETLNDLFIGQNETRTGPSDKEIQDLYDEHILQPYYVDGPGSAHVSLISAISLLCRYCNCLPADRYTMYSPNWYVERVAADGEHKLPKDNTEDNALYKVVIELPIVSAILDPIEGIYLPTKKLAKRAAALKACELLHKAGELDNMLLPKRHTVIDEDTSVFFKHWPAVRDKNVGTNKMMQSYAKHLYYPNRELSLDESMISWRGRLSFRQYLPGKRHKYGIKCYVLAEPSGLALKMMIYTGAKDLTKGVGHASTVVIFDAGKVG